MKGAKDGRAPPQRQQFRYTHHTSFFQNPSKMLTAKSPYQRTSLAVESGVVVRADPFACTEEGLEDSRLRNNPSYIRAQGY